jgi:hypothetical protein
VGNKADLVEDVGEVIDRDECARFAEENNSIYIETSAKTGQAVEEAFTELTKRVYKAATGCFPPPPHPLFSLEPSNCSHLVFWDLIPPLER